MYVPPAVTVWNFLIYPQSVFMCIVCWGAPKGGAGAAGLRPNPNRNLKYTDFADTMMSNVLGDLPCRRNPPLNPLMKFKK